jgi:hypothetical protein
MSDLPLFGLDMRLVMIDLGLVFKCLVGTTRENHWAMESKRSR